MANLKAVVSHHTSSASADRCPLCDQAIPHEQSDAVLQRIAAGERQLAARAEVQLREALEAARANAAAEIATARLEVERKAAARLAELEAAHHASEATIAQLRAEQEARERERLAQLREQLEREKVAAVQAAEAKAFEDKQKLHGRMADLQRQLENKTAQDLGYGPEVDLFELLKAEFPDDRISRVDKGVAGPDVIQDVYSNGRLCGRIVYDSKNSSAWRSDYVTKLKADQAVLRADHAVLSTRTFPASHKELHVIENVLIISPARVAVIAGVLRRQLIQTSTLRLSNEAREQKSAALYRFIMSDQAGQLLGSISSSSSAMADLDQKEEKAHAAVWKKRAELIRSVQKAHDNLSFEIERIIGVAANHPAGEGDE